MSLKLTDAIFKNAAYTRAFFTQMKHPSQSVSYDKTCWTLGDEKFQIKEGKMNAISAFFSEIVHKINLKCSSSYRTKFRKTSSKFKEALARYSNAQIQTALVYHKAMVAHSTAKSDFEATSKTILELEKDAAALNEQWLEAEAVCKDTPPPKTEEDPLFLQLKEKFEALNALLEFIPEYVRDRAPKEGFDAIRDFFDKKRGETQDKIKLREFADALLGDIPLNQELLLDCKPFEAVVLNEIKKLEEQRCGRIAELEAPYEKKEEIDEEIKLVQEELQELRQKRILAAKVMRKISQQCDDMHLHPPRFSEIDEVMRETPRLPSAPLKKEAAPLQAPPVVDLQEAPPKEIIPAAPVAKKEPPPLQPKTKEFLAALEASTSKNMRDLWEGLLENIAKGLGEDAIVAYKKAGGVLTLQLKEKVSIFMLSIDKKGKEDPNQEPQGGSVFTLGDENGRMTFTPKGGNEVSMTGFVTTAHTPPNIGSWKVPTWIIKRVGEYVSADLPTVKIKGDEVTIVAYKSIAGIFSKTVERVNPLVPYINHWKNDGRVLDRKASLQKSSTMPPEERFLRKKRAKLIKDKLITP